MAKEERSENLVAIKQLKNEDKAKQDDIIYGIPPSNSIFIFEVHRQQLIYYNRGEKILKQREKIKQKTLLQRRINHLLQNQNQSLSFV